MYEVITEQGGRLSDACQAAVPRPSGNAAASGQREGAAERSSCSPVSFPRHEGGLKRVAFLLLQQLNALQSQPPAPFQPSAAKGEASPCPVSVPLASLLHHLPVTGRRDAGDLALRLAAFFFCREPVAIPVLEGKNI